MKFSLATLLLLPASVVSFGGRNGLKEEPTTGPEPCSSFTDKESCDSDSLFELWCTWVNPDGSEYMGDDDPNPPGNCVEPTCDPNAFDRGDGVFSCSHEFLEMAPTDFESARPPAQKFQNPPKIRPPKSNA